MTVCGNRFQHFYLLCELSAGHEGLHESSGWVWEDPVEKDGCIRAWGASVRALEMAFGRLSLPPEEETI